MSEFKRVYTPPKDGTQFIAMWSHNGSVWSNTCRYNDLGYLEVFSEELNDFETGTYPPSNKEIIYYTNW